MTQSILTLLVSFSDFLIDMSIDSQLHCAESKGTFNSRLSVVACGGEKKKASQAFLIFSLITIEIQYNTHATVNYLHSKELGPVIVFLCVCSVHCGIVSGVESS